MFHHKNNLIQTSIFMSQKTTESDTQTKHIK